MGTSVTNAARGLNPRLPLFVCRLMGVWRRGPNHSVTFDVRRESRAIVALVIAQPEQNGCRRPV
jgi:hypothetical protein